MAYETIIVEIEDEIALIRLNRPEALNALNSALITELAEALREADGNDKIRCVVLTGSEKAFAAGADIKEMSEKSFVDVYEGDLFGSQIAAIRAFRKPMIAAVSTAPPRVMNRSVPFSDPLSTNSVLRVPGQEPYGYFPENRLLSTPRAYLHTWKGCRTRKCAYR